MGLLRFTARVRSGIKRVIRLRWVQVLLVALGLVLLVEIGLNVAGVFLYRPIQAEMERVGRVSAGDFVILCVGDSHVYGIDSDRALTWPSQLAAVLERSYPDVHFGAINMGVPGYNSSETLQSMQEALERHPGRIDMVIFEAGRNNGLSFRKATVLPPDFSELPWHEQARFLLTDSKAYRLGQLAELRIRTALNIQSKSLFQMNLSKEFLMDWLAHDYRAAVRTAREHGVPIVFMNYVIPGDLFNGYVTSAMKRIRQEEGVVFVDVENFGLPGPAFFTMPVMRTSDGHPNERGNRLIANILAEALQEDPGFRKAVGDPFPAAVRSATGPVPSP